MPPRVWSVKLGWVCQWKATVLHTLVRQWEDEAPSFHEFLVCPSVNHQWIPTDVVDHGVSQDDSFVLEPDCPRHYGWFQRLEWWLQLEPRRRKVGVERGEGVRLGFLWSWMKSDWVKMVWVKPSG